jgi:hypothetical protein
LTPLSFLFRRASHYWPLLLTLSFGVILATTFLASGPVLVDAVLEFGQRRTLLDTRATTNLLYLTARETFDQEGYQNLDQQVQGYLENQLMGLFAGLVPSGHVGYLYPWQEGETSSDHRVILSFYGTDQNELAQHVSLVGGSLPDDSILESNVFSVFVGSSFADDLMLNVGDRLPVSISTRSNKPEYWLSISGIIAPNDPQDPYWIDEFNPFQPMQGSGNNVNYGVFVTKDSFLDLATDLYPNLGASYTWQVLLELGQFKFKNIDSLETTFSMLDGDMLGINDNLQAHTILNEIFTNFVNQANVIRPPIYFLFGIVVLMALYYLVMMASLYLDQVGSEYALLRSRGVSGIQLFQFELLEAVLISGTSILCGPLLAWLFVRLLASGGPLAIIIEPGWGLSLPQTAWLSASVAAVACVSSLLLPLPKALKQSIATHQRRVARLNRPPWWQRVYLDVFVLVAGLIFLYRVELYGSIIGGTSDTPQVDLMLLLAPLCLLIGAAAIFLRIFPDLLHRGARVASLGRGLPAALALWQAARDPRHVTRLVFLLMLAMALGLYSTSLDATLDMNERERSQYYVGSDARIVADEIDVESVSIPGVRAESIAWRTQASLDLGKTFPVLNLLAVDPQSFNAVARYRDDFAPDSIPVLLDSMIEDWEVNKIPIPGLSLPGEPMYIGLWFTIPFSMWDAPNRFEIVSGTSIEARLLSVQDEQIIVPLHLSAKSDNPNVPWYYFKGEIPEMEDARYPLRLLSLWIRNRVIKLDEFEPLWIDSITLVDRNGGKEIVVEDFEYADPSIWWALTFPLRVFPFESNPYSGKSSLSMFFDTAGMSPVRWYGINQVNDPALQPIPALASPAFQSLTELQPGDLIRMSVKVPGGVGRDKVTFKIVDYVNYFPTMFDSENAGFLVTLRDPLLEQINIHRYVPVLGNELIIAAPGADTVESISTRLSLPSTQVFTADSILQELKSNPLVVGLRSVTLFGYFLTSVLSLVGFGSNFYLSTRQRAANYGILRALGMSPKQLYTTLLLEQIILIFSGLALGTVLGLLLNELTLSGLPLRIGEWASVPPFIVQTDWVLVLRIYLTLAAAFLISLGMAIHFLWRVKIHRVLRIGEE